MALASSRRKSWPDFYAAAGQLFASGNAFAGIGKPAQYGCGDQKGSTGNARGRVLWMCSNALRGGPLYKLDELIEFDHITPVQEVDDMASSKSKTGVRSSSGWHGRAAGKSTLKTAFFLASLPKGGTGLKLLVPNKAYQVLASEPGRLKAVLQQYGKAVSRSRAAGRTVSFRVDVDPAGATTMTPVEEVRPAQKHPPEESGVPNAELQDALAAARERGRLRAADILSSEDMLSAEDFAKLLGTTRVTVNTKRQSGQI